MTQGNGHNSAIGWIDFSSEHREKVKTVMDLLASPGVVDELGIGMIRDSFSDTLFPGISTIQTRAKYFLTLPRIFRDYKNLRANERRRITLADYLKQQENRCMSCLNQNHKSDPQDGIIGASFAGKRGEVQRKQSSVYWNGLRTFGQPRQSELIDHLLSHIPLDKLPAIRRILISTLARSVMAQRRIETIESDLM